MASKKGSDAASYVASYLKAQDASPEEEPEEFSSIYGLISQMQNGATSTGETEVSV